MASRKRLIGYISLLLLVLGLVALANSYVIKKGGLATISLSEAATTDLSQGVSEHVYSLGRGDNVTADYFIGSGSFLTDLSTYNATYDALITDNSTWNQSHADTLYWDITKGSYNATYAAHSDTDTNYSYWNRSGTDLFLEHTGDRICLGCTDPADFFHINTSSPIIRLEDTDTNAYSQISASTTDGSLILSADAGNDVANSDLIFKVDSVERARIDTSGRFIVGSSSASYLSTVNSQSTGSTPFAVTNSENDYPIAYFYEDASGDGIMYLRNDSNDVTTRIYSQGDSYLLGGDLGIGTKDNPSAKIHARQSSTGWIAWFENINTGGAGVIITTNSSLAGDSALAVRSEDGDTHLLDVQSDGTIGVLRNTANHALDVNGNIASRRSSDNAAIITDKSGSNSATALVAGSNLDSFLFTDNKGFSIQPRTYAQVTAGTPQFSSTKVIVKANTYYFGLGGTTADYPLQVTGKNTTANGISIYAEGNVSADDYITRTAVWDDKWGSVWDWIKPNSNLLTRDSKINHSAMLPNVIKHQTQIQTGTNEREEEFCYKVANETTQNVTEVCEIEVVQEPIFEQVEQEGISISEMIAKHEQALYELKQENNALKSALCGMGQIQFC